MLIVFRLSNILKLTNYSDCFRVTRNFAGDCFAQSRSLFGEGTKEEERHAWEGKAAAQTCKPVTGFVPDDNNDLICFTITPKKTFVVLNIKFYGAYCIFELIPFQLP